MHWGYGFWPIIPLLIWIGIAFCIFGALRYRSGWRGWQRPASPPSLELPAQEILRRRYALGEIDDATFERMRERLQDVRE